MSIEQAPRTFVCGVVSVDLVGYSKLPVSDQIDVKARFNACLADTLNPIAVDGRIILDTGDGVVIGFLNDPEDALFLAMALSRTSEAMAATSGQGRLRIGINLGPVRLGTDLNQHATLVGDGVNVAEQIMSFAKPGTVVASRAFHDFAGRLSGAYETLFHFEGSRTDKYVRDHEVYTVRDDDRAFQVVRRGVLERAGLALPQDGPSRNPGSTQPGKMAAPASTVPASPGGMAAFLRDPAKVGFAAMLLGSLVLLEGYFLWSKLRARSAGDSPAQVLSAAKPDASKPASEASPPASPPPAPAPVVTAAAPTPAPTRTEPKVEAPAAKPAPPVEKPIAARPQPAAREPIPDPKLKPPANGVVTKPVIEERKPPEVRKPVEPEPKRVPRKNEPKPADQPVSPIAEPSNLVPVAPAPVPVPTPQPAAPPVAAPLEPISRAPVGFPIAAVRQGITEGRVKARATINAAGSVVAVEIVNAYPPRLFDRAVMESVSLWKFPPGADRRSYEVDVEFKR